MRRLLGQLLHDKTPAPMGVFAWWFSCYLASPTTNLQALSGGAEGTGVIKVGDIRSQLTVNAAGFSGSDCEKATAFLEHTLG